jgi:hypothetical protein
MRDQPPKQTRQEPHHLGVLVRALETPALVREAREEPEEILLVFRDRLGANALKRLRRRLRSRHPLMRPGCSRHLMCPRKPSYLQQNQVPSDRAIRWLRRLWIVDQNDALLDRQRGRALGNRLRTGVCSRGRGLVLRPNVAAEALRRTRRNLSDTGCGSLRPNVNRRDRLRLRRHELGGCEHFRARGVRSRIRLRNLVQHWWGRLHGTVHKVAGRLYVRINRRRWANARGTGLCRDVRAEGRRAREGQMRLQRGIRLRNVRLNSDPAFGLDCDTGSIQNRLCAAIGR